MTPASPAGTAPLPSGIYAAARAAGLTLSASLLAAPSHSRVEAARAAWKGGAWAHADVIDGRFGAREALGIRDIRSLTAHGGGPVDVHLMVDDPAAWCERMPHVQRITVQLHADLSIGEVVAAARERAAEFWWAIDAGYATGDALTAVLATAGPADGILVMLTPPGRAGAELDPSRLDDVRRARAHHPLVGVDGGVTEPALASIRDAGAGYVVCGRALFDPPSHPHPQQQQQQPKQALTRRTR